MEAESLKYNLGLSFRKINNTDFINVLEEIGLRCEIELKTITWVAKGEALHVTSKQPVDTDNYYVKLTFVCADYLHLSKDTQYNILLCFKSLIKLHEETVLRLEASYSGEDGKGVY